MLSESASNLDHLIDLNPAGGMVDRSNSEEERLGIGPYAAHSVDNSKWHAQSILGATTVFVIPMVRQWRQELIDQVAVGAVNLDRVEASSECPFSSSLKGCNDTFDLRRGESMWHSPARIERDRTSRDERLGMNSGWVPLCLAARLAPRVAELNSYTRAKCMTCSSDARKRRNMSILEYSKVDQFSATPTLD